MSAPVFVSYRSEDEPWATLVARELRHRFHADTVFRDSESIRAGEDFRTVLNRAVAQSLVLVAVIGAHWSTASLADAHDWVRAEIALAGRTGVRVVPVLVGDVEPVAADELPDDIRFLAYLQYLQIRHRSIERDLDHVVDTLLLIEPRLGCSAELAP